MESYEAEAVIAASPEDIWKILTDARGYTDWDSGVVRIEGEIGLGDKIKVFSEVSPDRAFSLKVAEFEPGKKMTWKGGMPLGLFKGVRTFTLFSADDAKTEFKMREEFSGPMLRMIWRSMPDLQPSFDQFAKGLKARAEAAG